MEPADGLVVVVGVPVSLDSFARDHMRGVPAAMGTPTVAQHVAALEDEEAATLMAGMSLALRTARLKRNVDPRLGEEARQQADVNSPGAVERVIELADAADHRDFADSGFDQALVILHATRQM